MIPSGGDPAMTGVTEAEVMRGLLMQMGIHADKIVMETRSETTIQNAVNVLTLINSDEGNPGVNKTRLTVVTSAYHLPFSMWCFRQVASALEMDIELSQAAANGPGAFDEFNVRFMVSYMDPQRRRNVYDGMRDELKKRGIRVRAGFEFESIHNVISDTLAMKHPIPIVLKPLDGIIDFGFKSFWIVWDLF